MSATSHSTRPSKTLAAAIEGLNAKDFGGRNLNVNEARERQGGRSRR
ncbi:MAG: hypothetical protein P8181_09780 [bacterium]